MTRKAKIVLSREVVFDDDPDLSWLTDESRYEGETANNRAQYIAQDQRRLEGFNSGDWWMVGVRCKAEIMVPHGTNPESWIKSVMRSPGVWGIESDSGEDHFDEVYHDERAELLGMLESIKEAEIEG
jgi:hypothetical protein